MLTLAALLCALAATGLLYGRWKGLIASRWVVGAGWITVLISCTLFATAWGVEFGVIYGVCAVAITAWLWTAIEAEAYVQKHPVDRARWPRSSVATFLSAASTFVMAILLTGVASVLVTLVLTRLVSGPTVDRMTLAVLVAPTLWGIAMVWALAAPRTARWAIPVASGVAALTLANP
ncbi:MAG: hypothetical protein AAGI88_21580 [Pseudomonadota bacterium]